MQQGPRMHSLSRPRVYESELNNYLHASPSLGCGTSSVGSVKYADTVKIHLPMMTKRKGSGRQIKGGKELAMEQQEEPVFTGRVERMPR